jgi:hypothetical protein
MPEPPAGALPAFLRSLASYEAFARHTFAEWAQEEASR